MKVHNTLKALWIPLFCLYILILICDYILYLIENDYGSEEFMDDEDYEDEGNCVDNFSHLQYSFISFVGPFDSKEGDYEVDDEMYDTEGMFDDYMGLDGKQDDEGMLDNTRDNNSEL